MSPQALRQQNLKLLERIFTTESFENNKIDKDFDRFLSKTVFIHYELCKKFIEQERSDKDQLSQLLQKKDIELKQLHGKISQLEEVPNILLISR